MTEWVLVILVTTSSTFFADKHYREIKFSSLEECQKAAKSVQVITPAKVSDDPPVTLIYCKPNGSRKRS